MLDDQAQLQPHRATHLTTRRRTPFTLAATRAALALVCLTMSANDGFTARGAWVVPPAARVSDRLSHNGLRLDSRGWWNLKLQISAADYRQPGGQHGPEMTSPTTSGVPRFGRVERFDTVVIGAGQAGLAAGHELAARDVDAVIVTSESRVGDTWRRRWDSRRLLTPAAYSGLLPMLFPAREVHLGFKPSLRHGVTFAPSASSASANDEDEKAAFATCRSCGGPPRVPSRR